VEVKRVGTFLVLEMEMKWLMVRFLVHLKKTSFSLREKYFELDYCSTLLNSWNKDIFLGDVTNIFLVVCDDYIQQ